MLVAAEDAFFVMSYVNVALSPDGGATWHLSRMLPRHIASEILMSGDRIGAQRLHELGVVNSIAAAGAALTDALALAEKLNAKAPNAVASMKELMNDAADSTLARQLAAERDHFVKNLHHANAGEGIAAFLAKRPPKYE